MQLDIGLRALRKKMNRDKKEAVQRASQNAHDEGIKEGIRKFK